MGFVIVGQLGSSMDEPAAYLWALCGYHSDALGRSTCKRHRHHSRCCQRAIAGFFGASQTFRFKRAALRFWMRLCRAPFARLWTFAAWLRC